MNLIDLTEQQRAALIDLALLAMYADGHLAATEDERIQRLLISLGMTDEFRRAEFYDAAVARISRYSGKPDKTVEQARMLSAQFSRRDQCQLVYDFLKDLAASDNRIAPAESTLLAAVREVLFSTKPIG